MDDSGTQFALFCDSHPAKDYTTKCTVNEAELSDGFGVQETENVKPNFVWELRCHQFYSTSNWTSMYWVIHNDKAERGSKFRQHGRGSLYVILPMCLLQFSSIPFTNYVIPCMPDVSKGRSTAPFRRGLAKPRAKTDKG